MNEIATTDYDIATVVRLTSVTSRTLRHYDSIGLLTPAWIDAGGRRQYGHEELLRLQHILVLRELGTPLATIRSIVDAPDESKRTALLRDHLTALEAERDRYKRLAATVRATLASIEQGETMTADAIFEGFDHARYEPEARERWGDASVDRSNDAWKRLGADGQEQHVAEHRAISEGLAAAASQGDDPGSDRVQALVARHFAWVSLFWTPDADTYQGLAGMYVDDPRFRKSYDDFGDGTAELLRDGIGIFAEKNLPRAE